MSRQLILRQQRDNMWTLGERGRVYSIKVDVSEFQGELKVHIRHYRKSVEEGEVQWYPTKMG